MNRLLGLLWVSLLVIPPALAADTPDYSPLSGKWQGAVVTNLKNPSGGGNPTQGETGTPVTIHFMSSPSGLTGTSTVGGNPSENWTIAGDTYTWTDGTITVTTKRLSKFDEIPTWVRDQAKLSPTEVYHAFKYHSCTVNKDRSPCKIGTDLPNGIDKTGLWIFTVKQDKMTSDVFYTYDTGGRRILQQSLTRATAAMPPSTPNTTPSKK